MADRLVAIDTDKARGDRMAAEVQDEVFAILMGLSGGGVPAAVDAAGAVMNTDTTTTDMAFVDDSEDLTDPEDIDVRLATRRAVRKWIEARLQGYAQPKDEDLTAFAALALGPNRLPYSAGDHTWAATDLTAFARTILDDETAPDVRATIKARALDPRPLSMASSPTPMAGWSWDSHDELVVTAQAETITSMTSALSGVAPTTRRQWVAAIKDDGTARTITSWGTLFRPIGVTLPSATLPGKWLYIAGKWEPSESKIHVLSVQQEL